MILGFDIILLTLVLLCAVVALFLRDLMGSVIIFGAYSFLMCVVWACNGAIDVAFTEAAVGAGVGTVFLVSTIYSTTRIDTFKKSRLLKQIFMFLVVCVVGVLLLKTVTDLPQWGDPTSPANTHLSSYYIENSIEQTHVPNVVTSVLADYRGFDTMFETCVVFVAFIGIFSLLKTRKSLSKTVPTTTNAIESSQPPHQEVDSLIIRVASHLMVPFMQLFSLYVVAHGHYSPGGGFQGGVILGASLILLAISYNFKKALAILSEKKIILFVSLGVLIYAGIGVICLLLGGNFLDYSVLHKILPATDTIMARSHAMLGVEIGVALTVMVSMYGIYLSLSSNGRLDKGL
ncbi:sodium:proton antiporter [Candidatus Marinamargulisbacteria bacterium SCGC AG-333-B06]|nr:sodium:proton antiporter [Candidatus Marinamargulisbacteria bacterium SCGC AG-333-B06]